MLERAYSTLQIKSSSDAAGKRRFTGIASTIAVDRMQDVVESGGMRATLPVALLWQHDHKEPVGWVKSVRTSATAIEVDCEIADVAQPGPLKDRLDSAWQSIQTGLVRGLSIGFRPLPGGSEPIAGGGTRWTSWEMLELSCVTLPANSDCSITAIKSIDQQQRRTASGAGVDRAAASEKEMCEAEADFERAYARGDAEAMRAIARSDSFKRATVRTAAKRAETMAAAGGTESAHLARMALAICVESQTRNTIVKIQRAYRKSLEARVDQLAQRLSAATKAIAALEKKGQ